MGALPKNKITRAERGKRRRGNRPTIIKDATTASVPLHKRGLVAEFLQAIGIKSANDVSEAAKTAKPEKKASVNKAAAAIKPEVAEKAPKLQAPKAKRTAQKKIG